MSLVHIHVPKTGGTSLAAYIEAEGLGRTVGHTPARDVVRQPGEELIGVVRDPWSWYVSWWRHCTRCGPDKIARLRKMGAGGTAFGSIMHAQMHGGVYQDAIIVDIPPWRGESMWSHVMRYYLCDDAGDLLVDHLIILDSQYRFYSLAQGLGRVVGKHVSIPRCNTAKPTVCGYWYSAVASRIVEIEDVPQWDLWRAPYGDPQQGKT